MKKEFKLSEKKIVLSNKYWNVEDHNVIEVDDFKEFIRLLKKAFPINCREHHKFHNEIDKLSGDLK